MDPSPQHVLSQLLSSPDKLSHLSTLVALVDDYIDTLDNDIRIKQAQVYSDNSGAATDDDLIDPANISHIQTTINHLCTEAQNSQSTINAMTAGIKRLDNTKNNLTISMTTLKQLQMLTTAYSQLELVSKSRNYKETASLLSAVVQLMSHFKPLKSIDQIALLAKSIAATRNSLYTQIMSDFNTVFDDPSSPLASSGVMPDACRVLDIMDHETNNDPSSSKHRLVVNKYTSMKLKEYTHIFKPTDEAGSFDNISTRYGYIKRLLKSSSSTTSLLFPPSWKVDLELAKAACLVTRKDIDFLLTHNDHSTYDMKPLLSALNETLSFEHYLHSLFPHQDFEKLISTAFEPFLNSWIDSQDRTLSSMIHQYKVQALHQHDMDQQQQQQQKQEPNAVDPSSADLFFFYKETLLQASKMSTGSPLAHLSRLFGKYLNQYATQVLQSSLPPTASNEKNILKIAKVISTADYCLVTTRQLEMLLVEKIDSEYKEKISFSQEQDSFTKITNNGIKLLVLKVDQECDYAWRELANTNWKRHSQVCDQSQYVEDYIQGISKSAKTAIIPTLKSTNCRELYISTFCDKIVELTVRKMISSVILSKPITEVGAEQLLLDLYVIKSTLLKLQPAESSPNYTKHVNRSVSRIETILKVILTPPQGLIQNYFYLIGDKSKDNFIKILQLKGINQRDFPTMIELFNSHMSAHDSLVESSPVMSIVQMVPEGGGPSSSLSSPSSPRIAIDHHAPSTPPLQQQQQQQFSNNNNNEQTPPQLSKLDVNFRNLGRLFRRGDGNRTPK